MIKRIKGLFWLLGKIWLYQKKMEVGVRKTPFSSPRILKQKKYGD